MCVHYICIFTLVSFQAGITTTRHSNSHPMQCILTRADHDLYYGESGSPGGGHHHGDSAYSAHAFTCPFCGKLGFTELTLVDHVASHHADATQEVVCPICASTPMGDANHVTDDFSTHLTLEHQHRAGGGAVGSGGAGVLGGAGGAGGPGIAAGPRDLISFLDSPGGASHSSGGGMPRPSGVRRVGRGGMSGTARARRTANVHNPNQPPPPPSGLSSLSPTAAVAAAAAAAAAASSRESVDPIAELLSQLSGVRRAAAATGATSSSSSPSQLQQLQVQLQMERQQVLAQREQQRLHHQHQPHPSSAASAASRPGRFLAPGGVGGGAGLAPAISSVVGGGGGSHGLRSGGGAVPAQDSTVISVCHPPPMANASAAGYDQFSCDSGARAATGAATAATLAASGVPGQQQFLLRQSSDEEVDDFSDMGAVGVNLPAVASVPTAAAPGVSRHNKSQFVQDLVLSTLMMRRASLGGKGDRSRISHEGCGISGTGTNKEIEMDMAFASEGEDDVAEDTDSPAW